MGAEPVPRGLAPGAAAIGRSLRVYHAAAQRAGLDAFQARFLGPGELGFDIGAHVGDRTASFVRLGARAVAVEPQPRLCRVLRLLFGRVPAVHVVPALVGAAPGVGRLFPNHRNPTIATASADFIAAAGTAERWAMEAWDAPVAVDMTTLDALIAVYGRPDFIKVDVEGYEADVLAGLGVAVRVLSFEFTTIQRDVAFRALARLEALGYRAFNACLGESRRFAFAGAVSGDVMRAWIGGLEEAANSGDVYAALEPWRIAA